MGLERTSRQRLLGLAAAIGLAGAVAAGEVYRCTDDSGQARFQQTPCAFQLSQEDLDAALADLARLAREQGPDAFAEHVTRNALGGFADSRGRTVLMFACSDGPEDTCRWALESGEDPRRKDAAGENALAHAARAGRLDNLELLLNHPDAGRYTPGDRLDALVAAVDGGRFETALALLETGVDPNAGKSGRRLPLAVAVTRGHADLLRLLVRHGADPSLGPPGGSAAELALAAGEMDLLSALNPVTRRLPAGPFELAVPAPEDGWDCQSYSSILDDATRRLLAAEDSGGACYIAADRIALLAGTEPLGLGQFRFSWRVPAPGSAAADFSASAARFRRLFDEVFVDEPERIGFIQATQRPAGGGSALVSTCATVLTRLVDVLGEVQFCRYGLTAQSEVAELRARAQRWQERITALNGS